jgi:hypothetical protein
MTTEIKIQKTVEFIARLGLDVQKVKVYSLPCYGVECEVVDLFVKFPHGEGQLEITASKCKKVWEVCRQAYPKRGDYPSDAKIWEGRGYTGGHVSQSGWDTDQQYVRAFELLEAGYHVCDLTEKGNVGGYYPSLAYWK